MLRNRDDGTMGVRGVSRAGGVFLPACRRGVDHEAYSHHLSKVL